MPLLIMLGAIAFGHFYQPSLTEIVMIALLGLMLFPGKQESQP